MNVTTLASLTGGKVITADIDSDAEDFVNKIIGDTSKLVEAYKFRIWYNKMVIELAKKFNGKNQLKPFAKAIADAVTSKGYRCTVTPVKSSVGDGRDIYVWVYTKDNREMNIPNMYSKDYFSNGVIDGAAITEAYTKTLHTVETELKKLSFINIDAAKKAALKLFADLQEIADATHESISSIVHDLNEFLR